MLAVPTPQGRAWYAALGAEKLRLAADPHLYEDLAVRARTACSDEHAVLDKDIGRTFPERPEFQTPSARDRLRRVLGAYALRNTYCQGMSYVAALMLQHLPERDTFWAVAALIESFLPAGYFNDKLQGAYMDQHIAFAVFLPHLLPKLAAHLTALEFPLTLIGVRWFLCLFAADMEPEHTCKLWDLLFAHGAHILFALALGLLSQHEERLLAASDVAELFSAVRSIGKATPSWRELHGLTRGFPSEADVQVARAAYQREQAAPLANAHDGSSEETPTPPAGASTAEGGDGPRTGTDAVEPESLQSAVVATTAIAAAAPSSVTESAVMHERSGRGDGDVAAAHTSGGVGGVRPRKKLPADVIDEAMAEVEACREANARLDAGRAALREAVTTREELAELLGGEARLKALRAQYAPPRSSAQVPSESQSFWSTAAAAFLNPTRALFEGLLNPAGDEGHHGQTHNPSGTARRIMGPWSRQ